MTLEELKTWMKSHKHVDTAEHRYDECGNLETMEIFQDGDKLFGIEFLNGHPLSKYQTPGIYQPHEVIKKTYTATYYEFM
jgi:hypothetical protein